MEKRTFKGTNIEIKIWPKKQLADALEISYSKFIKELQAIEPEIQEVCMYNPNSKLLTPRQVRMYLRHYGYLLDLS